MNLRHQFRRIAALGALASALLLSGCLFTPGKFTSELVLRKGGQFSYFYDGEISMAGLNQLANMGGNQEFTPSCMDDETFEERDCTRAEVAEQRAEWDRKQEQEAREKEQFAKMFGGIDMSDPKSADALAAVLRKQAGWNSVDYQGDGLFVVSFALNGQLSHSFEFPKVEQMPMLTPFISVYPRNDGNVRIDAPGFGGGQNSPAMGPGMGMLAAMGAASSPGESGELPAAAVLPDGVFVIVTDGNIRANNTNEGAVEHAGGMQRLEWKVDVRSQLAPMALIDLR